MKPLTIITIAITFALGSAIAQAQPGRMGITGYVTAVQTAQNDNKVVVLMPFTDSSCKLGGITTLTLDPNNFQGDNFDRAITMILAASASGRTVSIYGDNNDCSSLDMVQMNFQ